MMHTSPTMVVPAPESKSIPVKTNIRQEIMEWITYWPEKPTIWDRLLFPLKWSMIVTGFVALASVVAVVGVVMLPLVVTKIAFMIPG